MSLKSRIGKIEQARRARETEAFAQALRDSGQPPDRVAIFMEGRRRFVTVPDGRTDLEPGFRYIADALHMTWPDMLAHLKESAAKIGARLEITDNDLFVEELSQ